MVRISTRIELSVKKLCDTELLEKLPDYGEVVRIFCLIKFKTKNGWTGTHRAIADTGAHTSVIPYSVWKNSEHEILATHCVRSIVPEYKMSVKVVS